MHETLQPMSALCKVALVPLQLGGVHADGETANMNVSAVALAAVDIAATALDSALLSVERTVERSQQRPEVIITKQHDEGLHTCHGNCEHVHLLIWVGKRCTAWHVEHFMQCCALLCENCIHCGLVVYIL